VCLSAFKRKNIFGILLYAEKEKWASKIHFCEDVSISVKQKDKYGLFSGFQVPVSEE